MATETLDKIDFVVEDDDKIDFVAEPLAEPQLQTASPEGFIDKIKSFFRDPEREQARAMNVYALSKVAGISLHDANSNYDILKRTSKVTGLTPDIEAMDYLGVALMPAIATAFVANPPMTAATLLAFGALDKVIPTKEWIKEYEERQGFEVKDEVKKTIDLVDFVGKGLLAAGVTNKSAKMASAFIERKIAEYKLPVDMAVMTKMEELTGVKPTIQPTIEGIETPAVVEVPKVAEPSPLRPEDFATAEEYVASKQKTPIYINEKSIDPLVKAYQENNPSIMDRPIALVKDGDEISVLEGEHRLFAARKADVEPPMVLLTRAETDELNANQIDALAKDKYSGSNDAALSDFFRKGSKSQLTAEWEAAKGTKKVTASTTPTELTPPVTEKSLPQPSAIEKVETPVPVPSDKVIAQERGLIKSVKESPMVTKETKEAISDLPKERTLYDVYGDDPALAKAKEKVETDPEGALTYVMSTKDVDKDVSTTALELMRKYREKGDVEKEVAVMEHIAEKATKSGQFIQAFSMLDKLSPEGVLLFAQKEINRGITDIAQRKTIDPKFAEELKLQAQIIQDTPYGYQKVKEINKLYEMIGEKKGKRKADWLAELFNTPRTLMSSFFDFSFGLRQGAFLMPSFAKEWGGSFSKQFGAFAKEANYDALMDSIMKHPDFRLAEDSGVAFTDIRGDLSKLEERYMGASIAERIPILGSGVRATQRAYTGMANKMRMDVFSRMIKDLENLNLNPRGNKRLLQEVATFVNAGTGRGGLGGVFKEGASLLNAFFFSPRLMSSRLTLLNPHYYVTRSPGLRKQALKSLFSFMGLWGSILTMAKLAGAEVGTDWRSADFGKIKIDNTRIDVGAGFGQYMRMFGQMATGEYISSATGKKMTLGEGYKPLTRMDILMRQIESKEAPVFSLISDILKQKSWNGEDINIPKEVALRFTPMVIQDMYDLSTEAPDLLPLGLLTVFGTGVQTYQNPKKKVRF